MFFISINTMMEKELLVSIIVPVCNVEKYLSRCVESLLSQSYKNTEIILVDDGSTDSSGWVADYFAKKHHNIHVIHKGNGGLSNARNTGLRYATGEWVAFVDPDDYVDKHFIATLLRLAQANNADIATCSYYSVRLNGETKEPSSEWMNRTMTSNEAINDMFRYKRPNYIWQNLFKMDLFYSNDIVFPEGREYEDISTKVKTLYFASKIAFTNEKLYYYVERKESITNQAFKESVFYDKLSATYDIENLIKKDRVSGTSAFFDNYKYLMIESVLADMSRRSISQVDAKKIWRLVRRQLTSLYPRTKFPSGCKKIKHGVLLLLSSSRWLYGMAYRFNNNVRIAK